MKKKLREMTEEEILKDALLVVPEYRDRVRDSGKFVVEDCVQRAQKRIEMLYRANRGLRPAAALNKAEGRELEALIAHFRPKLIEAIRPVQQKFLQRRMVANINGITAGELIPAAFAEAGLRVRVEGQTVRAKVQVELGGGPILRFYVRYSDLRKREDAVDNAVKAVLDLKDAVSRLGYGVVINKKG